ncbi:hypothetical protein LWI29_027931 [Acer saccharum]|uniref:NB-ARC domain-containing protein n=1 Tax=Acer saccharum TaxID=4024 RepID=A0AA39VXC4_ACESA|nr:hypothetical protein LWI29_027931 [Acer saccharum]
MVDGGSYENIVSAEVVSKLRIKAEKHPKSYRLACSVYLLLQDLKIQEFTSIYRSDWMDVMRKIGKYTSLPRSDPNTCDLWLSLPSPTVIATVHEMASQTSLLNSRARAASPSPSQLLPATVTFSAANTVTVACRELPVLAAISRASPTAPDSAPDASQVTPDSPTAASEPGPAASPPAATATHHMVTSSNSMGTFEQRKEDIINGLNNAEVSKIVLVGDAGMGKTWMAREIINREDLWYETFWVYVTEKYDINLFYKDIARQLSLSSITEEWEHEKENTDKKNQNFKEMSPSSIAEEKEHEGENSDKKNENFKKLSSSIAGQELEHEEENSDQKNQNIKKMSEWGYEKIIEWGYEAQEETTESLKKNIQEKMGEIIEVACPGESKYFLLVLDDGGNNLIKMTYMKSYQKNGYLCFLPSSTTAIAEKSEGIPAAIIVIAEALNYIARHDDSKLESAISKASQRINPLFYCAFDMITSSVTKNCFWHSMHLFRSYSGVHYNELITHWVMEGYFDPFDHIEEAYQKGHGVLMELIDRALLKIQENNIVEMERAALNKIESCLLGFSGTATVRLFSVFKDDESLGRVTWMDGMIKTLCNPNNWEKNTTLLIDGSRLSREVHQTFFDSIKGLEVLAVFNGRCKSLASSLSKMKKLLVLVLRSCDLLDDITDHINKLKTLKVLEISGACSFKSMPDKLFDGMTNLQSLNLSGLQMETLPSFSKLSELLVLILRGCSRLEKLQSLRGLEKLQILDISDATSFERFDDPTLSVLPKIQMIHLSNTNIQLLPEFDKLQDLTQIFYEAVIDQGRDQLRSSCSNRELEVEEKKEEMNYQDEPSKVFLEEINYQELPSKVA